MYTTLSHPLVQKKLPLVLDTSTHTCVGQILRCVQRERNPINELLPSWIRGVPDLDPVWISDGGAKRYQGEALTNGRRGQTESHVCR